jgi:hypothetical protein
MIVNTRSGQLVSKLQSTVQMYVSRQHSRDPSRKRRVAPSLCGVLQAMFGERQGNQLDVCFLASSISSRLSGVGRIVARRRPHKKSR